MFHCTPPVAERLILDDPQHEVVRMLELRSYAHHKAQFDAVDGDITKLEQSSMMDLVIQVSHARQVRRHG